MTQIEDIAEQESGLDTHIGRVRWTICAMLFFATSINYMDRQVIALLKPTLAQNIGLTEIAYGYIVDAFQIAYAVGLLVAGRVVDKIGTRIGYVLIMGIGGMAGSAGGALLAFFTGHILQRTHSHAILFILASSVYLLALLIMRLLAPGLRKVEFSA